MEEESGSIDYARNFAENLTDIAKNRPQMEFSEAVDGARLAGRYGGLVRQPPE